jgi:hypothetical protein
MSDLAIMIALCEKLGLKRVDTSETYGVPSDEFWVIKRPSGAVVLMGGDNDSYPGFYVRFDFDPAGNLTGHGIFE